MTDRRLFDRTPDEVVKRMGLGAALSGEIDIANVFHELLERRQASLQLGVEQMNDHFTKFHVHGLPVGAVFHRFTNADGPDADPHDHPWDFTSLIISGGYVEQVFRTDAAPGTANVVERKPGDVIHNKASTIHRITRLLTDECWTLILPGPGKRKPGFYRFDGGTVFHRFWDETEFSPLEPSA